jgi:hypothetical protein
MSLRRRALSAAILGAIGVVIATVIVLIQFTATYATSNAIRARITPAADAVEALVLCMAVDTRLWTADTAFECSSNIC